MSYHGQTWEVHHIVDLFLLNLHDSLRNPTSLDIHIDRGIWQAEHPLQYLKHS
ncbi:Uncharacterised protein [Chlamydia trachomatis]|nr:Uncharacterised protein [Chlamydia trachomatis]